MDDTLQTQIDAYIDEHWEELIADIESLVSIPSIEDLKAAKVGAPFGPAVQQALEQALSIAERMGFETHDDFGFIGYADVPGKSNSQLGIIGHLDVVPAGSGWNVDPFALTRREGYLLGRGVLDDKGPLMVALHAVNFWKSQGGELAHPIRVLFGVNEETGMGDVSFYRSRTADPAFLFTPDSEFPVCYGEMGICNGYLESREIDDGSIIELEGGDAINAIPGSARALIKADIRWLEFIQVPGITMREVRPGLVEVKASGRAAHASKPELGDNAVSKLVFFLLNSGVGSLEENEFLDLLWSFHMNTDGSGLYLDCSDDYFGSLSAVGTKISLEDGCIRQGVDIRYPTTTTGQRIITCLENSAQMSGSYFELAHDKAPFMLDPNSPGVSALDRAFRDATGELMVPYTSRGGTYARLFSKGVSFGPVMPWLTTPDWVGSMHGPDEGVSEELLKQAFAIYVRAIGNLMEADLS